MPRLMKSAHIAGLDGFVTAWWILNLDTSTDCKHAFASLTDFLNGSTGNTGKWNWIPYETGEFYGLMPMQIISGMNSSGQDNIFAAVAVKSEKNCEVEFHFDLLSNYRLWCNCELIADRLQDSVPVFDKACLGLNLLEGINIIGLEIPFSVFAKRWALCGRLIPDEGLEIIGPDGIESSKLHEFCSPFSMFKRMTCVESSMKFMENAAVQFEVWQQSFRKKYMELIGDLPDKIPLHAVATGQTRDGDITIEDIWLETEKDVYMPMYILLPDKCNGRTVLALHGHGKGRNDVAGIACNDFEDTEIRKYNYNYGLELAKRGFIVAIPTLRCFGERSERSPLSTRDVCDINFNRMVLYGENTIKYQIFDLVIAIDYLESRIEVDPARIGVTGLSYGGRMAMNITAYDFRIKTCVSSGAFNLMKERVAIGGSCGSQFIPGLLKYGDNAEIFGLVSPRPLLCQLGTNDDTSPEIFAMEMDRKLSAIYNAAGVPERYKCFTFHEGHRYHTESAVSWLEEWL